MTKHQEVIRRIVKGLQKIDFNIDEYMVQMHWWHAGVDTWLGKVYFYLDETGDLSENAVDEAIATFLRNKKNSLNDWIAEIDDCLYKLEGV